MAKDDAVPQDTVERFMDLLGDADPKGTIPTDEGPKGRATKGGGMPLDAEPGKRGTDDEDEDPVDDDELIDFGDDDSDEDDDEDDAEDEESEEESEESADEEDETDEDNDEADDETPADESPTYKVKVDGEEVEVTLEEALSGYQRHSAFTKKTQALADEKREFESSKTETAQQRERYIQGLEIVEKILNAGSEEVDWAKLKVTKPAEFATKWAQEQHRKANVQAIADELAAARETARTEADASFTEHLKGQREKLLAVLPEWGTEKSKEERTRVSQYAQEAFGWTPDDVGRIPDHRIIVLLRESMLYRDLMADAKKVTDKAKAKGKGKPPLKPGVRAAPNTSKNRGSKKDVSKRVNRSRDRLKKSGSVHDAAAVFFDLLE